MAKRQPDYKNQFFELWVGGNKTIAGLNRTHLEIRDRYHHRRFSLERRLIVAFTGAMQNYLKNHPKIEFSHKRNWVRKAVYLPPGIKAWSAYMPGGLATYSVHNPEHRCLASGQRLDPLTRRLFRHSVDAVGMRSRAYTLSYLVAKAAADHGGKLRWLSLASGSGQPVYDTLDSLPKVEFEVTITDGDKATLNFAKQVYGLERPHVSGLYFEQIDVLNPAQLDRLLDRKFDFVDAMGLLEYLKANVAARLIGQIYKNLPVGGRLVFTNMSSGHSQRDLHKRGLGWPGVLLRSVGDMARIFDEAGVEKAAIRVYAPDDGVYNVYEVTRR